MGWALQKPSYLACGFFSSLNRIWSSANLKRLAKPRWISKSIWSEIILCYAQEIFLQKHCDVYEYTVKKNANLHVRWTWVMLTDLSNELLNILKFWKLKILFDIRAVVNCCEIEISFLAGWPRSRWSAGRTGLQYFEYLIIWVRLALYTCLVSRYIVLLYIHQSFQEGFSCWVPIMSSSNG